MIGNKLGYHHRLDGNFLIRKTCSHCGEGFDVHALSNCQTDGTDLCTACYQVREWEKTVSSGMGEGEPPKASLLEELILGAVAVAFSAGFWWFFLWAGMRLWKK